MFNLDEIMKSINRIIGQKIEKGQREIAKRYAKTLAEIRAVLSEQYEKYDNGGELSLQEMLKHDRLNKMLKEIDFLLRTHYKGIYKIITDILKVIFEDGYYLTAWGIEKEARAKLGYTTATLEMLQAMLDNPISGLSLNERLERQRVNIVYSIKQQVTQGLLNNETYAVMAKRLKKELEDDVVKATRIVRTEGHRVQESAKHDAAEHAEKNGIVMVKTWNTLEDSRVRSKPKNKADHRKLNNKTIPVNDLFDDGLSKGTVPGLLPAAGSSINCRCFLTYSIEKLKKVDHKELENITFDNWKKERLRTV